MFPALIFNLTGKILGGFGFLFFQSMGNKNFPKKSDSVSFQPLLSHSYMQNDRKK